MFSCTSVKLLIISLTSISITRAPAAGTKTPPFTVSIESSTGKPGAPIEIDSNGNGLVMVFTNHTNRPIKIWKDWNSWGNSCAGITISAINGDRVNYYVHREQMMWWANFADPEIIPVGKPLRRPLPPAWSEQFINPITHQVTVTMPQGRYINFPRLPANRIFRLRMQANFHTQWDRDVFSQRVWSGKVDSPIHEFDVIHQQ